MMTWKEFQFRHFVTPQVQTRLTAGVRVSFVSALRSDGVFFARQIRANPDDDVEVIGLKIEHEIKRMNEYLACTCTSQTPCLYHTEHP